MKTIQQPSKVFILAYVDLVIAHLVNYGHPITTNGTRLEELLLKKVEKEIRNLLYRGRPEVHLILLIPSDKNGPLWRIDSSGWASLRSLNSCCHLLRETCLLNGCGSRSQACRFRLWRSLCGHWLNGCVINSPLWEVQRESELTCWLGPKTRACWAIPAQSVWVDNIRGPRVWWSPCPRNATRGKAYVNYYNCVVNNLSTKKNINCHNCL